MPSSAMRLSGPEGLTRIPNLPTAKYSAANTSRACDQCRERHRRCMRAKGRICIRCSDLRIECTFKQQLRRRNDRKLRWLEGTDNRAKPECVTNAPAITKLSSENPSYLYFKRFDYFWLPRYGRGISSSSSGDMAYLTPDGAVHSTCDLKLLPWLQEKGIKKLFNVEEEGQQICHTAEAILKLRFFTWQSFAQVIHLEASQYRAIAEFTHTAKIVRVELRRSKDQIRLENAKESIFKFSLPHKKIYSIQFELEDPVGYTVVFIDQDERHVISRPIEKQKSLFQNQLLEDQSDKLRSFILMGQPLLWSNIRHDMSPVRLNEVNKQWKPMIDRLREQGYKKFSTLYRRSEIWHVEDRERLCKLGLDMNDQMAREVIVREFPTHSYEEIAKHWRETGSFLES